MHHAQQRWYRTAGTIAATTLIVTVISGCDVGGGQPSTNPPAAPAEPAPAAPTTPEPPPSPGTQIPSAGTYEVGTDIQPGVWRNPKGCYWARLSGISGEGNDVIANGGIEGGPAIVEIAPSDAAFQTQCGGWSRTG